MTKVFLSPSDQNGNAVTGGGNEQQYAQLRCARAAEVLRAHGITVLVSERGKNNGNTGFLESLNEGNAWGPDIYVADHTNAANGRASGVQAYCYPEPNSQRLGACINARMDPIVPGGASIQNGEHLGEVNGSYATAVLMESGYHDNPTDAAVIRSKTTEMGEAIAYGILDYLGVTAHPVDSAPAAPASSDGVVAFPAYPFDPNGWDRLGNVEGPDQVHGGDARYDGDNVRATIQAVQRWLIIHGYAEVDRDNGWADGIFEQPTIDAVRRFQADCMPGTTYPGEVWADDYAYMASHNN